jgi:hypothetical protein
MNKQLFLLGLISVALLLGGLWLIDQKKLEEVIPFEQSEEPETESEATEIEEDYLLKGVSLSPMSFEEGDFTDFFVKAGRIGNTVTWTGDWIQLGNSTSPYVVTELCVLYDLEPLVLATYFDQSTGIRVRPLDPEVREAYISRAAGHATRYKPRYMGFGVEVNSLKLSNADVYYEFKDLFSDTYAAVKEVSPDTVIFTVFQLEHMKGLDGGLFGGVNDESQNQWELLDDFPDADLYAFTTYPCLIYTDPSEIPSEYFDQIREHTDKPVGFTESGWFRDGYHGWESSEEEQARFIELFFELTKSLDPEIMVWSFLYDQEVQEPFHNMGLLKVGAETSKALDAWAGQ